MLRKGKGGFQTYEHCQAWWCWHHALGRFCFWWYCYIAQSEWNYLIIIQLHLKSAVRWLKFGHSVNSWLFHRT